MSSEENVKVAVRVRPFNKREKERKAKLIVKMDGNTTRLTDPSAPDSDPKSFAFDFSYWSHDGSVERAGDGYWEPDPSHPNAAIFADQDRVYNDLGEGIMKNAWEGYHSTLFAYGQTGSGKSYSVVGYGSNKGIVPVFCDKLFQQIDAVKGGETAYEVTFSMIEIYNEVVHDLLNPQGSSGKKSGLRVREHKKKGFYAEKMRVVPVSSYKAIEEQMGVGTRNRTIAATNMNATSSRAHTIVGITFVQKTKNAAGKEVTKSSVSNLVDLAGSERVSSTGASGDRLKEGAAINQSLSALGNVISALADNSNGKKVKVPYRDSVLTKLLMNALGGNSKTIMIAAISPADINFDESLSTLRYADRAKQIKTKATVNEDPTDKLIRELQEENKRLQAQVKGGGGGGGGGGGDDDEDEEALKAQLEENEREMEEMRKTYEQRLQEAEATGGGSGKTQSDMQRQRGKYPHLYNLNYDTQLTGMLLHIMKGGKYKIGNQKGSASDFVMKGPSILEQHAFITVSKDQLSVTIEKASDKAKISVNGTPLSSGKQELRHNDRLHFGTTQYFVFANPVQVKAHPDLDYGVVSWELAQEELASQSGFDMNRDSDMKTTDEMALQEDIMEVMPAVEEANSISEALDKMVKFEMVLVSPEAVGRDWSTSQVFVRVRNFANGIQYEWHMEKFMDRFFQMQELYEDVEDDIITMSELDDEEDPFTESLDKPSRIGVCSLYLKSIAYLIEMKSELEITDIRGNEVGLLSTQIVPCDERGVEISEQADAWVDDPKENIGKPLHFAVKLKAARGLPVRFTDVFAKYKIEPEKKYTETKVVSGTPNPVFDHKRVVSYTPLKADDLEFLMDDRITVELWGEQIPIQQDNRGKTTSNLLEADALSRSMVSAANSNQKVVDERKTKAQMDSSVLKMRQQKMEAKLTCLRHLANDAKSRHQTTLPTAAVSAILEAPTVDAIEKLNTMSSNGFNGRPSSSSTKSAACSIS